MTTSQLTFSLSFRGTQHELSCDNNTTIRAFQEEIEKLTLVPPAFQKLLYKGKKATSSDGVLTEAGLKDGVKIQLLGSLPAELEHMHTAEAQKKRRDDIVAARQAKGPPKVRSTGKGKVNSFIFHSVAALPHLPSPHLAREILDKLANDPAILHVMSIHEFTIGLLTELAPHEHPELLGLNQNQGQIIKLRVRTNAYDGMRSYLEIRRVLCHELTHCVWGDHDNNFKELNSRLNREVAEYEVSVKSGTHTLPGYSGPEYEPSLEAEALQSSFTLGSGSNNASSSLDDTPDARRERILRATLTRLARDEKEIEDMCGNTNKPKS